MENTVESEKYEIKPLAKSIRFTASLLSRLLLKTEITGLENIPKEGPAVIATHHEMGIDPWILKERIYRDTGRWVHWWVQFEGLFNSRWKYFLNNFGELPILTDGEAKIKNGSFTHVMGKSRKLLQMGEIIGLYNDGPSKALATYGEDKEVIAIKPLGERPNLGVAALAARANVPVIPISVWAPEEFRKELWGWGFVGFQKIMGNIGMMYENRPIPYRIGVAKSVSPGDYADIHDFRDKIREEQVALYNRIRRD